MREPTLTPRSPFVARLTFLGSILHRQCCGAIARVFLTGFAQLTSTCRASHNLKTCAPPSGGHDTRV